MSVALNYQAETHSETTGERPGLVAAIVALGIANLNFPFLFAWAYLQMPPYYRGMGGLGMAEVFGIVFLAAWPAFSILLALWGLFRCFWHPRRLAAVLMASFALTLDGVYALLLLQSVMP